MSDKIETVLVAREEHPEGKVLINKCDMKPGDKLWSAPKPKASATAKPKRVRK